MSTINCADPGSHRKIIAHGAQKLELPSATHMVRELASILTLGIRTNEQRCHGVSFVP